MKELVEYIIRSIVDYPDQVTVHETTTQTMIVVEVGVSQSDMGRVIGKGGKVINSIRALLDVAAGKQGKRVSLELMETE